MTAEELREKKAEWAKSFRDRNKERCQRLDRERYQKNRESRLAYQRERYGKLKGTPEFTKKTREASRKHRQKFPGSKSLSAKFSSYRCTARKKGHEFRLSREEFDSFGGKLCFYCGGNVTTVGIDRVDNNIGYRIENLVPCCTNCNLAKNDLPQSEFIEMCNKVANKHPHSNG